MKVAFVVAFPHEWSRFEPLRRHFPDSVYLPVAVPSADHRSQTTALLARLGLPFVDVATADLEEFDVFMESWYWGIDGIYPERAKRVRMMYGYANKNNTTFSEWNAHYDMVLTFGPFASDRLAPFAPVATVGNPKFDDFAADLVTSPLYPERRKGRAGVLCLPTGTYPAHADYNFSSIWQYLPVLSELGKSRRVLLKPHPDVVTDDPQGWQRIRALQHVEVIDPEADTIPYLAASEAVLTDASGVIMEAIAFGVPVILGCARGITALQNRCFLSLDPAEDLNIFRELGTINADLGALAADIDAAQALDPAAHPLLDLFYDRRTLDAGAGARAAGAVADLVAGRITPTHTQRHLQDLVRTRSRRHRVVTAVHLAADLGNPAIFRVVAETLTADVVPGLIDRHFLGSRRFLAWSSFLASEGSMLALARRGVSDLLQAAARRIGRNEQPPAGSSMPGAVSSERWQHAQKNEQEWWQEWFGEHGGNDDEWLAFIMRSFGITAEDQFAGQVLVDVGGGPIGILSKLSARRRVVIDPQSTPSVDPTLERLIAPGEEIPLEDGTADVVFMYNVLQHVRDPRQVLDECVRIAKPGGRIYLNDQLYVPTDPAHPHTLTESLFQSWFVAHPLSVERWEVSHDQSHAGKSRRGEAILNALLHVQQRQSGAPA